MITNGQTEEGLRLKHKTLETERRESDERFRLLVEGVKDYAIFMLDPQGHILSWNSGAQRIKDYKAAEIIGQHFSIFYPKEDIASGKPERELRTALAAGRFEDEGWRVRQDRTQFWAAFVITPLHDEVGNLRGFAEVTRDITERKYAEKVLKESEERTRRIIESAHDAFIAMDARGIITDWNLQAERIFGWPRAKAIGRPAAKIVLPLKYRKAYSRGLERYRASGTGLPLNRRFEMLALHHDGHQFPVEIIMTCLQLEQGYILAAFLHDITDRREAEEKLRKVPGAILIAEETERKRVSRELHDSVGQILSAVKFRIQSMEGPSVRTEQDTRRMLIQTRTLLARSIEEVRRIAHNLMPSELEDLGLMAAVRSLCAEFRKRNEIALKLKYFRIPTDLGNDVKLASFRIVQEALNNIEKHAGATRVSVHVLRKRSVLKTSITDNGKGFDRARHHSANSRRSGMGIVNMRERARFVGGKFIIRSAPNRGTLIEVEIPITGARKAKKKPS